MGTNISHDKPVAATTTAQEIKVVLIMGAKNSGKTSLFNILSATHSGPVEYTDSKYYTIFPRQCDTTLFIDTQPLSGDFVCDIKHLLELKDDIRRRYPLSVTHVIICCSYNPVYLQGYDRNIWSIIIDEFGSYAKIGLFISHRKTHPGLDDHFVRHFRAVSGGGLCYYGDLTLDDSNRLFKPELRDTIRSHLV